MKIVSRFVADDGREFVNENDCLNYENDMIIRKHLSNILDDGFGDYEMCNNLDYVIDILISHKAELKRIFNDCDKVYHNDFIR